MTVQVPHVVSHKTCYDDIQNETPELWARFEKQVLARANQADPVWQRLVPTLDAADAAWAAWLADGGQSQIQVVAGSWTCAVGDISQALVDASIDDLAESADRTQRLQGLLDVVEARLEDAPNQMAMQFALMGAIQ